MELQVLAEIDDSNVFKRREKYTDSQQDEDRLKALIRKHGRERTGRGGQGAGNHEAADDSERPRRVVVSPIRRLILDQGDLKAELAHCGERARPAPWRWRPGRSRRAPAGGRG